MFWAVHKFSVVPIMESNDVPIVLSLKTAGEQSASDERLIFHLNITLYSHTIQQGQTKNRNADQPLTMGTEMFPEMSVIFNQLIWLIAQGFPFSRFWNIYMHFVAFLEQGMSPWQGLYLHSTAQHKHRKKTQTYINTCGILTKRSWSRRQYTPS
jgi:hypothetical protein